MERIVSYLLKSGVDLASMAALEVFAREGDWVTCKYAPYVKSVEAWEINPSYLPKLQKNIPGATTRNVDSIKFLRETTSRFDFISVDNPQGIYGDGYCENFEVLPNIHRVLSDESVLVFLVNCHPFDARLYDIKGKDGYGMNGDMIEDWFARRNRFFGTDARELSPSTVQSFFESYFRCFKFKVTDFKLFPLPSRIANYPDFINRCLLRLKRI